MFNLRPSRPQMYADDSHFLWKSILRSLAIILAITAIGLIGWSLAHQVDLYIFYDDSYAYGLYPNDVWLLPWTLIALGLSVVWNVANGLVLVARNRPIHPGANVACDLLLWLALAVTGAFASVDAQAYLWWFQGDHESYDSGFIPPNGTVSDTDPITCPGFPSCVSQSSYMTRKGVTIGVGAALSFTVLLMHFALFVSACRFTNARRVTAHATALANRMYTDKIAGDAGDESRNPNAGFVPISEPVEQQAPLNYGMPPPPTGMTVGDHGRRRAAMGQGQEPRRGTRNSCEQPEAVVVDGGERAVSAYGDHAYAG